MTTVKERLKTLRELMKKILMHILFRRMTSMVRNMWEIILSAENISQDLQARQERL